MRKHSQAAASSRRRLGSLAVLLAAGSVVLSASVQTQAQTLVSWVGATGDYNTPANWNPAVTPSNDDNHFLMINNGGTAQVAAGGNGAFLHLGLQPGDTGHLQVSGGTLTLGELRVGGRETLPNLLDPENPIPNGGGTGSVVQTGGTVSVTFTPGSEPPIQSLYIGDAGLSSSNTANGSYTISNNAVLISGIANNDSIVIGTGSGTQGTFVQQDTSTVTSSGFVAVSRRGATASYTMTGGTLNVGSPDLPASSAMSLWIADGANADATALVPNTQGTFTQSAGTTVNVKGGVEIGRRGGTGTYTITGGALNVTGQIIVAGNGGSGVVDLLSSTGTFNVSGTADITIGTNFNIGLSGSGVENTANATLNMTGGSIDLTGASAIFAIGNGRRTTGTVDLSAGSITMNRDAGSTSDIDLGRNNGNGLFIVRGTGSLSARRFIVNSTNFAGVTREFRIEGGTVDIDQLIFGSVASQATRSLNISGGNVHLGFLSTGSSTGGGSAVTHIFNNAAPVIDSLEMFSNSTVKVSSNLTLTSLNTTLPQPNYRFGNATMEVASGATLTVNGPGNFGTGAARALTKTGGGTLTINAVQNYVPNSAITVNEGTLNLNSATTDSNLTVNANSAVNFGNDQSLAALNVADGVTATLLAGGSHTLTTNALNLNSSGTLDLTNNALTINDPGFDVRSRLQSAFNNGAWNGPGITSSTARDRADNGTGLGWINTGSQIDVLYTWAGDLNLDKKVDGDDFIRIDLQVAVNGFGAAATWQQGDVNYDGIVTVDDYFVIDTAYAAASGGVLSPGFLSMREAQFGAGYISQLTAAVPEPGSLAGAVVATFGIVARRRRGAR